MATRSRNLISKPLVRTDGTINWPPPHCTLSTVCLDEPTSYTEASKHSGWRDAMAVEINALLSTNTWTLVPPTTSSNTLGVKWVFKTKRHSNGSIERRKARLVAKGYHQLDDIDFTETFSPVAKPSTVRLLFSIAAMSGWSVDQLDVHNAFLHGDLSEDVHISQPPGFVHSQFPNHVCRLHKSLYGLKQPPYSWFAKLTSTLVDTGFSPSRADSSLFTFSSNSPFVFILIYIDDILVVFSNPLLSSKFITHLSTLFPIKNLGAIHYFLGIQITRSPDGFTLSQSKYIRDLLTRANMDKSKPVLTPMTTSLLSNCALDSPDFGDPSLYHSIAGSLQYLAFTRPDISFVVNKVCQFMHQPKELHWKAVKRILRYLSATTDHCLHLSAHSQPSLSAFSDEDWAGDHLDRRLTGAYCVSLGNNLISWSSCKQQTVARSLTKAEYCALAQATCELLWIQSLLADLHVPLHEPPILWCDNLGATYLALNPVLHHHIKHISLDYHFVRERVLARSLQVAFLSSKEQLADILTKPLPMPQFNLLRSNLCLHPLVSRGGTKATNVNVHNTA